MDDDKALKWIAAMEARGLLFLAVVALIVGAISGAICSAFRLSLEQADALRARLLDFLNGTASLGPFYGYSIPMTPLLAAMLMALAAASAAALAAGLVRRVAPAASGSGIPHVEAVVEGAMQPAPLALIPVKFCGGVLAMGGGLALGREGPSVQMGATVGHLLGGMLRMRWSDRRALIVGGAGAGLATAFNAPVAGAVFVLEELLGRFDQRISVVALGTSVGAIVVSRAILSNELDFQVPELAAGGLEAQGIFLLLGLFVGLLAYLYNRTLLTTLTLTERIGGPVEMRAALIGAAVGLLAWYTPDLVGGGDNLTQLALSGEIALAFIPMLFLIRLLLSTFSYAAATPGGLFAPMLVLGAVSGLAFGTLAVERWPDLGVEAEAFAVVGMAAFFAGAVRAPVTGIVLVTEMTGSATLLLPLLAACFGATLVVEMLREPPIYASLRNRAAKFKR
ncbi:MAG: H(+)/Cl(-) exchange transporter ClcA [Pseudomonadota bacterium]